MSIEEMIQNYGTYINNYAMKLTCHPQKAEDLAQETFIQAWRKKDQLRSNEAIGQWLRMICYRQFLMDYRKEKNDQAYLYENLEALEAEGNILADVIPEPEEEIVIEEDIRELRNGCFYAMVRRLSLHQRIVFSMIDMFGLTVAETAHMMDLSECAVKGLLHRARLNIDSFFGEHCNLIHRTNPCSCRAWLNFRDQHETNQKLMSDRPFHGETYQYDPIVRGKIYAIYRNMPEYAPESKWFEDTIQTIKSL